MASLLDFLYDRKKKRRLLKVGGGASRSQHVQCKRELQRDRTHVFPLLCEVNDVCSIETVLQINQWVEEMSDVKVEWGGIVFLL